RWRTTKTLKALDRFPGLSLSISPTSRFSEMPRAVAMVFSTSQKASSIDTLVRWPAIVTERRRMVILAESLTSGALSCFRDGPDDRTPVHLRGRGRLPLPPTLGSRHEPFWRL